MNFFQKTIKHKSLEWWLFVIVPCFLSVFLSGCFTGIESTKKISLSREDRKNSVLSAEEKFMTGIMPSPLKEWESGKSFIVSDDRAMVVLQPEAGLVSSPPSSIKGEVLKFHGVESKINPAGVITVALLFSDGKYIYSYDTGKEFDSAMEEVLSDQVPMLIDVDMVEQARDLLMNHKLWTRTNLWYDDKDNRIDGLKYVSVTVVDVTPGNMLFPLKLRIKKEDGGEAFVFMNFGNSDTESRSFHNLFSLTDITRHYPGIDADTWGYISRGKVREGMTKEEVKLALGNPTDLNSGHDYSQTLDIWSYDNGIVLWFEDGRLVKIRQ